MDILFLDANIFFAATASSNGASHALFLLARQKRLKILTHEYALKEAKRNIELKLGIDALAQFYVLVSELIKVEKEEAGAESVRQFAEIIAHKDIPILDGAHKTKANYLITLDKKDFFSDRMKKAYFPFKILLPGEYLRGIAARQG